jgi:hypothetical protein
MGLLTALTRKNQPAAPEEVNITSAAFNADPYPFDARLRAEAPVHRVTLPDKQTAWIITRYDADPGAAGPPTGGGSPRLASPDGEAPEAKGEVRACSPEGIRT